MNMIKITVFLFIALFMASCGQKEDNQNSMDLNKEQAFKYQTEQFADLAILRYRVPGFEELTLKQKELLYYLSQAALSGRDIFYDQNYKYNLEIRRTLEAVVNSYNGSKEDSEWKDFMIYTKRVWFSNGIHHHYSNKKFDPGFSKEYFVQLIKNSDKSLLPLKEGETVDAFLLRITPLIFDPDIAPIKVNLSPEADVIKTSAVNFYENVTQKEVEDYYSRLIDPAVKEPVSYGLNSKLIKQNGVIEERKWKVGGMYTAAIEKIVGWLEKAVTVSENDLQKKVLEKLIEYYKTGDLKTWDEYNKLWVRDTASAIDAVNGFIEVYNDPLGYRGSYESVVSFKDKEATKRIEAISSQAQWFEDHSPIDVQYKKKNVVGITAKVITVVVESGDASPSTPIGINLPNPTWIRKEYGSKSVNLGNIVHAYNEASSEELLKEFCYSQEEIDRAKKYGDLADDIETDLHEVIGHASGQLKPGVGSAKQSLKNYGSSIEEARADLVALYYLPDNKLVEIGVLPDNEAYKAEYDKYIRNGLIMQLARVEPGANIQEAHMRNRQLIAKWVYEKGKPENIIEKKTRDGKAFFVINDYSKLRNLIGELLKEVQRITSEGDYEAAKNLVEKFGVIVDPELHKEALERYKKLNVAPYKGCINPVLTPVMENGKIVDVKIEYPEDFTGQMLYYSKNYSYLPNQN
ncbi:MAG TPA: dihydrofolate reductase [Ignavibacteriaceae bacterium]